MRVSQKPGLIDIEDYLAGEVDSGVRHEYLGGQVHAMSGGSNRHNIIATNCLGQLYAQLRGKPCQPFNSDTKVRIRFPDHTRFYYPDAMVVCQANPEIDQFQDQPVVAIEVLSESTRRTDLSEKRDAYFTIPTLMVLIFLESDKQEAVVYRRQADGSFAPELHTAVGEMILLPEIEAALSFQEVYERVAFKARPI